MITQCISRSAYLLGHGVGRNVLNGILDAGNLIGLGVGNFNGKLILDGHNDLDGIQRIQTQIVGKLGRGGDLGGVDLVEVLHDGDDAIGNLGGVDEGLIVLSRQQTSQEETHTYRQSCPRNPKTVKNHHNTTARSNPKQKRQKL